MKYDELVRDVREQTGIAERGEAERTVLVVLQALSDRLTGEEAYDLLAQLPEPLKSSVTVTPEAVPMKPAEFVERIAQELEVPPDEARERVRGVFAALRDAGRVPRRARPASLGLCRASSDNECAQPLVGVDMRHADAV